MPGRDGRPERWPTGRVLRDAAEIAAGAGALDAAIGALVALVRLPGGALPDDVAILLARATRRGAAR